MKNENLFSDLFKYKPTDKIIPLENFTTEILKSLLKIDEAALSFFLLRFPKIERSEEWPRIESQFPTNKGILDILITDERSFSLIIENKVGADFQENQIRDYKSCDTLWGTVYVVVLTKNYNDSFENAGKPDETFYWSDFSRDVLEKASGNAKNKLMRDEFLKFLKKEKIAMDKIDWTLVDGLKQRENLINMIRIVLDKLKKDGLLKWRTGTKEVNMGGWYSVIYEVVGTEKNLTVLFRCDDATLYICLPKNEAKKKEELKYFSGFSQPQVAIDSFDFKKKHFFPLESYEQENALTKFITDAVKNIKDR